MHEWGIYADIQFKIEIGSKLNESSGTKIEKNPILKCPLTWYTDTAQRVHAKNPYFYK